MTALPQLKQANFDYEVAGSQVPVLLDFTRTGSEPCQSFLSAVEAIAKAFEGSVKVMEVDVEAEPLLKDRFGVIGLPTTILVKNGVEVARRRGPVTRGNLAVLLERHVSVL